MRVTQKGQVTIPLEVPNALGIRARSEVHFELDGDGARLVPSREATQAAIERLRGAGDGELSTDEILEASFVAG